MKICDETYVSDILREYGDIADMMELSGNRRIQVFALRKFLAKFITVKTAALNNYLVPRNMEVITCIPVNLCK